MWPNNKVYGFSIPSVGIVTKRLLALTIGVFLVEVILWPGTVTLTPFEHVFGLSRDGLTSGMLWQVVTYQFLHGSLIHILGNMLGLYFFGRELESRLGGKRFLLLYLGCGVLGGLGWLLLTSNPTAMCIGASGAVFGLIGVFAALYPHRRITLLVFFILPVTLSARTLAIVCALVSLVMLRGDGGGIAHAAHLVGGIAGYLYGCRLGGRPPVSDGWRSFSDWRARMRRSRFRVVMNERDSSGPVDWGEVDRILAKINALGMGSLTKTERDTLDRASRSVR